MSARLEWHGRQLVAVVEGETDKRMRRVAKRIYIRAKALAPEGRVNYTYRGPSGVKSWKHRSPGKLKQQLRWRKSKYKGGGYIIGGDKDTFYGRFVEFGVPKIPGQTYRRGPRKGEKVPFIKPQSFLRPALRSGARILKKQLKNLI